MVAVGSNDVRQDGKSVFPLELFGVGALTSVGLFMGNASLPGAAHEHVAALTAASYALLPLGLTALCMATKEQAVGFFHAIVAGSSRFHENAKVHFSEAKKAGAMAAGLSVLGGGIAAMGGGDPAVAMAGFAAVVGPVGMWYLPKAVLSAVIGTSINAAVAIEKKLSARRASSEGAEQSNGAPKP